MEFVIDYRFIALDGMKKRAVKGTIKTPSLKEKPLRSYWNLVICNFSKPTTAPKGGAPKLPTTEYKVRIESRGKEGLLLATKSYFSSLFFSRCSNIINPLPTNTYVGDFLCQSPYVI